MSGSPSDSGTKAPTRDSERAGVTSNDAIADTAALTGERSRLRAGADLRGLPWASSPPKVSGVIRRYPADFIVEESLAFPLTGNGEHLYLRIRKTGQNTRWVAKQLARKLGLPSKAIGTAGMKDRHAITEQWFSLHLPGIVDPDLGALDIDGVEVLDAIRHSGKLRTGALSGNRFKILVRDISGDVNALEARLSEMAQTPVPNYFGSQRFGHHGGNLDLLFLRESQSTPGRETRSFGLSALRSALFNLWLAQRIEDGTWLAPLAGEITYLEDELRFSHIDKVAAAAMCAPTGLLWGAGDNKATGVALTREQAFAETFTHTLGLLRAYEVRMMRRPLWLRPVDFDYEVRHEDDQTVLALQFGLSRGQFATSVIRELCQLVE
jgi:tRNA pseudouridine13 synthase